jgi:hypothetical protein
MTDGQGTPCDHHRSLINASKKRARSSSRAQPSLYQTGQKNPACLTSHSGGSEARKPPHVGDQFRHYLSDHVHQRVQPQAIRARFRSCTQRSAQGKAPRAIGQMGAAHPGQHAAMNAATACGRLSGRGRRAARGRQVRGDRPCGGEGIPVFPILAEDRGRCDSAADLWQTHRRPPALLRRGASRTRRSLEAGIRDF